MSRDITFLNFFRNVFSIFVYFLPKGFKPVIYSAILRAVIVYPIVEIIYFALTIHQYNRTIIKLRY